HRGGGGHGSGSRRRDPVRRHLPQPGQCRGRGGQRHPEREQPGRHRRRRRGAEQLGGHHHPHRGHRDAGNGDRQRAAPHRLHQQRGVARARSIGHVHRPANDSVTRDREGGGISPPSRTASASGGGPLHPNRGPAPFREIPHAGWSTFSGPSLFF